MRMLPCTLLVLSLVACDNKPADASKADAKAKTDAKPKVDAKAKTDDAAKTDTKTDAKADTKTADAKTDTKTDAKADGPAAVAPEAAPPRPADVPADWKAVTGDLWSFWVPGDWKVEDAEPAEGGTGDKGDKIADAGRVEGGMEVSSLSCVVRSDLGLPTVLADLEKKVGERAKADAKGHEATIGKVEVEIGATKQPAITVEYRATGDGTLVLERWAASTRAIGLSCSDQSSANEPEDRKLLETALASFRWTAPGA